MVRKIRWTGELVDKFWQGVAQTRLDELSFGRIAGPALLNLTEAWLARGTTCLDYGAGSGHLLKLLLDRGIMAAGFEPSGDRQGKLLEQVGAHPSFLGLVDLHSREQFDVVLLIEVIEHILEEDFTAVLQRVSGFVKPGGRLIVTTPNHEDLEAASAYCPLCDTLFHPWQHVRSFTHTSLEECLAKTGFVQEYVALADFSCDAETLERGRRRSADDAVTASTLQQLASHIESSLASAAEGRAQMERLSHALQPSGREGLIGRVKRGVGRLLRHRAYISGLHESAREFAHRHEEVLTYALSQIRLALARKSGEGASGDAGGVDRRIGNETTIVYVGRKPN